MRSASVAREGGCAIAVMAKAPRPGEVKTRLVPPLTQEAAAALSAGFLRDMTENIALAAREVAIRGYVAYAPAGFEAGFDGMLANGTGLVLADGTGVSASRVHGFGRSLLHAAQALFAQGHDAVCLLNSDSPTLPTRVLTQAAIALAESRDRVVLGPAEDGGYYVIGIKAPHIHLFQDIAWSTGAVAAQTRERARALGLPVVELDPWYDVDDPPALLRLCRELASAPTADGLAPYPAPATADCIERLGIRDLLEAAARPRANRPAASSVQYREQLMSPTEPIAARRYFETVGEERSRVADAPPVCIYLEVTNRCNLLCETCPRTFEALEPPADMSWELFTSIVDQSPGLVRAVLHGVGEPMLVKNLPRMIRYLKERGVYVLFNTNGTLVGAAQAPRADRNRSRRIARIARRRRGGELSQGPRQEHVRPDRSQRRRIHRAAAGDRRDDAARVAVADRPQGNRRSAPRFRPAGGADRRQGGLSAAPGLRRSRPRLGAGRILAVREDATRGRGGDRRGAGARPRARRRYRCLWRDRARGSA